MFRTIEKRSYDWSQVFTGHETTWIWWRWIGRVLVRRGKFLIVTKKGQIISVNIYASTLKCHTHRNELPSTYSSNYSLRAL